MTQPWMQSGPYTVFDFETTGLSPVHCRIIEIGAVRIETDGSLRRFQTLVNPECTISAQITQITGITNLMVSTAPVFSEVAEEFLRFIQGSRIVAHNARFDLAFLMESLARTPGCKMWNDGALDSIRLIRKAYPGLPSYSLQALRQTFRLGESLEGAAHRALYDAEITMEIFRMSMHKLFQEA